MKIPNLLFFLTLLFLNSNTLFSQTRENITQLFFLVDSSITDIVTENDLRSDNCFVEIKSASNYSVLDNRAAFSFLKKGISDKVNKNKFNLIYTIDNAEVNYTDIFRDGWFGNYLVERKTSLRVSLSVKKYYNPYAKSYFYTKIDTVDLEDIKKLENSTLPYTTDKIPTEPFFSSLFEPFVAIGAVVVTVVLLFTVRSN